MNEFKVIRNAHIYAPEDAGIQDVLICNDKMIDIQPNLVFSYDHEEIDASGKYLIPGFIDQHVHIIGGVGKMETLYASIRSLILEEHVDISTAISIITKNVADALLLKQKGSIEKGKDADIVLLDTDLNVTDVFALGKQVVKEKAIVAKNYYQY